MKKFIFVILAIASIAFAEPYHIDIQFKGFDRLEAIDSTDWIIDTLDNRCLLREEIKSHRDTIWARDKKIVVQPNRYVNEHPMDYYDLVTCKADDMVGKERYKLWSNILSGSGAQITRSIGFTSSISPKW